MKRRIFAAVLAAAMVLSLAACGGGNGGGTSSSNPGSAGGSGVSSSQPDGSKPDASNPDSSNPDGSAPDGSQPDASNPDGSSSSGGASSSGSSQPGGSSSAATLTLNKTDVTLKKAGSTFQLRYTAQPEGVEVFFSSSNEKVATVDGKGTVTAVGPGTATITATLGSELAEAACIVRCRWDDASSGSSSSTPELAPPDTATQVDLQKFYNDTTGKYEFGFLELADKEVMDMVYTGLSDVSAEQMLVYVCMMSMNNGEFCLVQVKDSKDVDTVKAIFQARVDYMVGDGNGPGGAQYPMAMDQWEFNSRIVSNGNYVMMVVHENCDDIVNEFNALF